MRIEDLPISSGSHVRSRVVIEEDERGRRAHAVEYLNGDPTPITMSPARMVFLLQRVSMEFTMCLLADIEFEEYVNAKNSEDDKNVQ